MTTAILDDADSMHRWNAALENRAALNVAIDSLHDALRGAVYVDDTNLFTTAHELDVATQAIAAQAKRIKALQREVLEARAAESAATEARDRSLEALRASHARVHVLESEHEQSQSIYQLHYAEMKRLHDVIAAQNGDIGMFKSMLDVVAGGGAATTPTVRTPSPRK